MMKTTLLIACGACSLLCGAVTQAQPQWIEANNTSLRYELTGNGKSTVVMLHEIGMSLEGWNELLPSISKGRQILTYDQRGFGQSEKIRGAYAMDDAVADLRALLDGLHINGPVTLVGGAIGATIALKFAAQYPARVHGLVLLSPIFSAPNDGSAPRALPAVVAAPAMPAGANGGARNMDTATVIETQGVRVYLDQQLESLYPKALRTNSERVARFYGIQLASDPTSRATVVRMASQNGDVAAELAKIKCPTLVVATSLFPLRPAAAVKPIADAIAGARFVDLPTGHLAALESPEMVAPMLLEFFKSIGI